MANVDLKIRREKSYPECGRLIVLESANSQMSNLGEKMLDRNFSIDFPAMPDSIELARQADYKIVSNMVVPDGVHQYRYTSPLTIPFTFMLHAMDDKYCPDGPLTLLRVAARLHAMIVPFGNSDAMSVSVGNDAPLLLGEPNPESQAVGVDASVTQRASNPSDVAFALAAGAQYDPPVTCRLELVFTEHTEPGIACNGYIKDVKVLLKGPWLRGPGVSYNLPTSGEFGFTFVHRPAHYNSFSSQNGITAGGQVQAFSDFVLQRFYNTRSLTGTGNYRGFTSKR